MKPLKLLRAFLCHEMLLIIICYQVFIAVLIFSKIGDLQNSDFPCFYAAGIFAGTRHLYETHNLLNLHLTRVSYIASFPYPAAFSYALHPLALMPIQAAYTAYMVVIGSVGSVITCVLARTFRIRAVVACFMTVCWIPTFLNFEFGQNAIIGLCGALLLLHAVLDERTAHASVITSLSIFKPTYAVFNFFWLASNRCWRAFVTASASLLAWYALSVSATGGNLSWPIAWLAMLNSYRVPDLVRNSRINLSLSGLLWRYHVPTALTALLVACICGAAYFAGRRFGAIDRFMLLLALIPIVSPHALEYDATFSMPALFRIWNCSTTLSKMYVITTYAAVAYLRFFCQNADYSTMIIPVYIVPIALIFFIRFGMQHLEPRGAIEATTLHPVVA